ncbi:MAG: SDR family NAD(P)-dependent oxidoreductase [Acidobacteriota bacterium]
MTIDTQALTESRSARARFLSGKHVVVTGGGRGIGAAIAEDLGRAGADLTLLGRDLAALQAHAAAVTERCGARVQALVCDVADETSVQAAFAAAREHFGSPHVLINNAGQAQGAPLQQTAREVWDRMLAVNLTGAFLCAQQVLPAMLEARSGRIVNVASTAGLRGYARLGAYCASKHGLIGLTRALALETAKLGITVNAVCPAYTDTAMAESAVAAVMTGTGKSRADATAMVTRVIPRGTLIQPSEVSSLVAWLCSPGASGVTGQALVVGGGELS